MIVKENVTVYSCEYCKKKLFRQHAMGTHEMMCTKNPDNYRPCYGCKYLEKKEFKVNIGMDYMGNDVFDNKNLLYCNAKESCLQTPQVEMKGNAIYQEKIEGEIENNPMPKHCDLFEEKKYGY